MAKTKKPPLTPEEKRAKNKIAVIKCKEKRKQKAEDTQKRLDFLEKENIKLTIELNFLRTNLYTLKAQFFSFYQIENTTLVNTPPDSTLSSTTYFASEEEKNQPQPTMVPEL